MSERALREKYYREGQKPKVIAITCSDARIKLPFGYGEAFVIRTAGNIIRKESEAWESLKYGVLHTTAQRIMVIGHNKCGAVKAYKEGVEGFGFITSTIEENIKIAEKLGLTLVFVENQKIEGMIPSNVIYVPPSFSKEEILNVLGMSRRIADWIKELKEMPVDAVVQNIRSGATFTLHTF